MNRLFFIGLLSLSLFCAPGAIRLAAQDQTKAAPASISPRAESLLRSACQFLAEARAFNLSAEIGREHVDEAGQKVQFSRSVRMDVRRPDGLRIEISSPLSARGFWYDGKTLTILDRKRNCYSDAPMPPMLDKALEAARDEFGIDLPLIDLAVSDPYKNATAKVQTSRYYGISPVLGVPCHHLAFTQENVDWQIWIEDGPQPFIRKFVITHKNSPGSPEFTALITRWDVADRVADSDFVFERPPGAVKIEMRADEEMGGSKK